MRLIDADELKKILCEAYCAREHYIGEIMLNAIDNAPTVGAVVNPLEVRPQGQWVDAYSGEYRCTNCSSHSETITPYCWCCGAKMKGTK